MQLHRPRCRYSGDGLGSRTLLDPGCTCFNPEHKEFVKVVPGINWYGDVKIFWSELRKSSFTDKWEVFVEHNGTNAPEKRGGYDPRQFHRLPCAAAGNSGYRLTWLANNKTQIEQIILQASTYDEHLYHLNRNTQPKESADMAKIINLPTNADGAALRRAAESLLLRAEELDSRPTEPATDDDGSTVIWWKMAFVEGGREYTYAATRTEDGLWYTTGPRSPKGYTWNALIEWIYDIAENTDTEPTIWVVGSWDILN